MFALLVGCGPVRHYSLKSGLVLDDAALSGARPVISYQPLTVDRKLVVDATTSGERLTMFAEEWAGAAKKIDAAFLEPTSEGPQFVANDPKAPYALTVEVVRIDSGEDMDPWLVGKKTWTHLLLTLWDQPGNRVLDRFMVSSREGGSWSFGDVGGTAAEKTREYLAGRFGGGTK